MDILVLPLLNVSDRLDTALLYMKQTDNRAILLHDTRQKSPYQLCLNSILVGLYRDKREDLSLAGQYGEMVVDLVSFSDKWFPNADIINVRTIEMENLFQNELDAQYSNYGYLPLPPFSLSPFPGVPVGLLVTRHESLRYSIVSTGKVCICDLNRHRGDNTAKDGGDCEDCSGHYRCY